MISTKRLTLITWLFYTALGLWLLTTALYASALYNEYTIIKALLPSLEGQSNKPFSDLIYDVSHLQDHYTPPPTVLLTALLGTLLCFALTGTFTLGHWQTIKYVQHPADYPGGHSKWAILWWLCPIANLFMPLIVIRWTMRRLAIPHINWLTYPTWPFLLLGPMAGFSSILTQNPQLFGASPYSIAATALYVIKEEFLALPFALAGVIAAALIMTIITRAIIRTGNLQEPLPVAQTTPTTDFQENAGKPPFQEST